MQVGTCKRAGRRAETTAEHCTAARSGGAAGWDPGVPAGGEPGFPRLSEAFLNAIS